MERTISSESPACVTEEWLLQTSLLNRTNAMKKMSQHPLREDSVKMAYITELLWRNHCLGSKTMSKGVHQTKAHKNWTIEQWNKVLWTDESKFEIFGSNTRVYVRCKVGERAAIPCIPPILKHGGGSVGDFCQLQSRGLVPGEGRIE